MSVELHKAYLWARQLDVIREFLKAGLEAGMGEEFLEAAMPEFGPTLTAIRVSLRKAIEEAKE